MTNAPHHDETETVHNEMRRIAMQALQLARQIAAARTQAQDRRARMLDQQQRAAERSHEQAARDLARSHEVAARARHMSDADIAGHWAAADTLREHAPHSAHAWDTAAARRGLDPETVRGLADQERGVGTRQAADAAVVGGALATAAVAVEAEFAEAEAVVDSGPAEGSGKAEPAAAAAPETGIETSQDSVTAADFAPEYETPDALGGGAAAGVEL